MDKKPLVYVVDDDAGIRDVLRLTVSMMNLDVCCFSSVREFLAAYDHQREACLIVDLRMPETTGQELLQILKERGQLLPAIVISGEADLADAVQAMKSGAIDFLEKPYSVVALRENIHKALAKARENLRVSALRARFETLTQDERQIAELTAAGQTDKQIAAKLQISTRTVQLRRASAMKKLEVTSKPELIQLIGQLQDS